MLDTQNADVRPEFNPSGLEIVERIKGMSNELIALIETIPDTMMTSAEGADPVQGPDPKIKRLKALAMTEFENGAMWAVKAATANIKN